MVNGPTFLRAQVFHFFPLPNLPALNEVNVSTSVSVVTVSDACELLMYRVIVRGENFYKYYLSLLSLSFVAEKLNIVSMIASTMLNTCYFSILNWLCVMKFTLKLHAN